MVTMRSITNYVMGIVLIGAGFFFFFPMKGTAEFRSRYDPFLLQMMGVLCWIYGLFRVYRGYKKNYFRES